MRNKVNPKSATKATSVEESIAPLRWYNVVLGVAVMEMPINRSWVKLSFFYAIVKWVAYGWVYFYTIFYVDVQFKKEFRSTVLMVQAVLILNIVITFISTFMGLRSSERVKDCFKKITLADETLEVFGIDPEYEEQHRHTCISVLIWIINSLIMIISTVTIMWYNNITWTQTILFTISFECLLVISPIVDLNFGVLIRLVGKRFERLNAVLQSIAMNATQSVQPSYEKYHTILQRNEKKIAVRPNYYNKNRSNVELLIKIARQLHLDLSSTARKMNEVYCFQISLQMGATFLLMTGFSYCLYMLFNMTTIPLSEKICLYIQMGKWMVVSILRTLYVLSISVQTTNEAAKSPRIAQETLVPGSQEKIVNEVHEFSLQTMQHPMYFTASGLITLDYTYVRGFTGSVVTYLMILIQNQRDISEVGNTLMEDMNKNETNATYYSMFH